MQIISDNIINSTTDMYSTTRNQENGDIIVTIVAIIWMLYCMHFNIERHIYLAFVP